MKLFSGITKNVRLLVLSIAFLISNQASAAQPQVAQPQVTQLQIAQAQLAQSKQTPKAVTIQEKRALAEKQFQATLKELSANQYFSMVAKHIFEQESLLNSNFSDKKSLTQAAPEALKLIDWLQKSTPEYFDANSLNEKLNKIFYFDFQEIIANLGLPQESTNKMLGILEQLYKLNDAKNRPFRAALSCGCLNISLSQTQKELSLKSAIDQLNRSLVEIKKQNPTCPISEEEITLFTQILFEAITAANLAPQVQADIANAQTEAAQTATAQTASSQKALESLSEKIDLLSKTSQEPGILKSIYREGKGGIKAVGRETKGVCREAKGAVSTLYYTIVAIVVIIIVALFLIAYYVGNIGNTVLTDGNNIITTVLSLLGGPGINISTFVQNNINNIKTIYQVLFATAGIGAIAAMGIFAPLMTFGTGIVGTAAAAASGAFVATTRQQH